MFNGLSKIAERMAGWQAIDDEMEDLLLTTVKAKRARRRRKQNADKKLKTRPRKWYFLLANIALLMLSLVEGIVFTIFTSVAARSAKQSNSRSELFPAVAAVAAYAWYSIKIRGKTTEAVAASILLKTAVGISLLLNLAITACLLCVIGLRE